MAAKIMKTLWDESRELDNETLTPHSILADDTTTNDQNELENMEDDITDPNEGIFDDEKE